MLFYCFIICCDIWLAGWTWNVVFYCTKTGINMSTLQIDGQYSIRVFFTELFKKCINRLIDSQFYVNF